MALQRRFNFGRTEGLFKQKTIARARTKIVFDPGPLRHYLRAEVESVIDFGDLQIFEGVTTYPAIVTMRRAASASEHGQRGELRFLNIRTDVPKDLARAFRSSGAGHAARTAWRWLLAVRE
jgi:hypothetical protein